ASLPFDQWTMKAEHDADQTVLRFYVEASDGLQPQTIAGRLHESLKTNDEFYRDLESMLGIRPLEVTLLSPGTFDRYYTEKYNEGKELTELQPPRMNPAATAVEDLLRLSDDLNSEP
ncbi:MAG: GH3 auxin-responsive promoter family protein, partial [Pseudomonadales bacterium]